MPLAVGTTVAGVSSVLAVLMMLVVAGLAHSGSPLLTGRRKFPFPNYVFPPPQAAEFPRFSDLKITWLASFSHTRAA
jgi:hypothetical protein